MACPSMVSSRRVAIRLLLAAPRLRKTTRLDRLLLTMVLLVSTCLRIQWLFIVARITLKFRLPTVTEKFRPYTMAEMTLEPVSPLWVVRLEL